MPSFSRRKSRLSALSQCRCVFGVGSSRQYDDNDDEIDITKVPIWERKYDSSSLLSGGELKQGLLEEDKGWMMAAEVGSRGFPMEVLNTVDIDEHEYEHERNKQPTQRQRQQQRPPRPSRSISNGTALSTSLTDTTSVTMSTVSSSASSASSAHKSFGSQVTPKRQNFTRPNKLHLPAPSKDSSTYHHSTHRQHTEHPHTHKVHLQGDTLTQQSTDTSASELSAVWQSFAHIKEESDESDSFAAADFDDDDFNNAAVVQILNSPTRRTTTASTNNTNNSETNDFHHDCFSPLKTKTTATPTTAVTKTTCNAFPDVSCSSTESPSSSPHTKPNTDKHVLTDHPLQETQNDNTPPSQIPHDHDDDDANHHNKTEHKTSKHQNDEQERKTSKRSEEKKHKSSKTRKSSSNREKADRNNDIPKFLTTNDEISVSSTVSPSPSRNWNIGSSDVYVQLDLSKNDRKNEHGNNPPRYPTQTTQSAIDNDSTSSYKHKEQLVKAWLLLAVPHLHEDDANMYSKRLVQEGFDSPKMLESELLEDDLDFMKKAHKRALIKSRELLIVHSVRQSLSHG